MLNLVETPDADPTAPRSQTSLAYGRIKSDILSGRYPPGDKLKISDLAAALEVSPGAIREALSRLVPEQLVISRDQKGFVVAPLSIADLEDLTDVRCEIETIALRRAVERGDAEWEANILASAHRLRRTKMVSDAGRFLSPQWSANHAAFHLALVSACGSRQLIAIHSQLYQQSERYRGLTVHLNSARHVDDEHQALVDAALDRDANNLIALTVRHFRETTASIVARRGEVVDEASLAADG